MGYLITRITDTGNGIKKKKMKNLFKTFKPEAEPGVFRSEGIGIGLSTARALVRCLGGNIFVSSTETFGTTVTFSV